MMPRLGLLVAVVLLVLIGIVMVFSASTVEAIHNGESATSYVVKQAIFVVFGSALALFVYTRDYRSLQGGPYFWVFWGICAALLLAVPVIGTNILRRHALDLYRWFQRAADGIRQNHACGGCGEGAS